jgi:hypothetical protein
MNSKPTQPEATQLTAAEFEQRWQEANRCNVPQKPCPEPRPHPEPHPVICEHDSEEINIYVNTEQSHHGRSGIWSWLPWLLLGLTSLLLLGNLLIMFAAAQSVNNRTKEVINTVSRSREVVRVEHSDRDVEHHDTPRARW